MSSRSDFSFNFSDSGSDRFSSRLTSFDSREAEALFSYENPITRGLLHLCNEIAFILLQRCSESRNPTSAKRELIRELVAFLPNGDEKLARNLMDLAIELIQVKTHGHFYRNIIDLGELIMSVDDRFREIANN